jgi:thymidylate kinase
MFDAKHKSPADYLPRLRELWLQEPAKAQEYFANLFGETGRSLEQWFECPAEEWRKLGVVMLARNKFGPALRLRECARVLRRIFQPTGICLTVMGSDGAGKSTLLVNLRKLLEPCFRYQQTFHFRPAVFEKRKTEVVTEPHGQPSRNVVSSWLKVIYYFADYWMGWWLLVAPARVRSTLTIFDRGFDDLLVDQKRYRLRGMSLMAGVMRRLLPKADRTFLLSAPAELLRQRKPELPLEELERQQAALQKLAQEGGRYMLVSAAESPEQVAHAVWRDVVMCLAAREAKRASFRIS